MDRFVAFAIIVTVTVCTEKCDGLRENPSRYSSVNYYVERYFNFPHENMGKWNRLSSGSDQYRPAINAKNREEDETLIPRLPSHYIFLNGKYQPPARTTIKSWIRPQPAVFEESGEDDDNFTIYRGQTAELIFNTMMKGVPYKMLEPVPGQVMRPPSVPTYKPGSTHKLYSSGIRNKASSNRYSLPKTVVPFYAHEAINPFAATVLYPQNKTTVVNDRFSDPAVSESSDRERPNVKHEKQPHIVYAIPYWKLHTNKENTSNYFGPQSVSQLPGRITTSQHFAKQVQVPFLKVANFPSTTPMTFSAKYKNSHSSGAHLPAISTKAIAFRSKPKKRLVVHYAKKAGFKSHLPLPITKLKKAVMLTKYANELQGNKQKSNASAIPYFLSFHGVDPIRINGLAQKNQ